MSDTAQLFIVAGVWAVGALFIARLVPGWLGKIGCYALLVGIPFWEIPFGYSTFRDQCNSQIEWRAYATIPPQDSICFIETIDPTFAAGLLNIGFSRIEVTGRPGNAKRGSASGHVVRVLRNEVKSNFCVEFKVDTSLPWRNSRHDLVVSRANDGQIVGRQGQAIWGGMWWQAAMQPILGNGGTCFEEPWRGLRAIRIGTG